MNQEALAKLNKLKEEIEGSTKKGGKPRKRKRPYGSKLRAKKMAEKKRGPEATTWREKRLADQGTRPHPGLGGFPPGTILSVQLDRCGHRARVEAMSSGFLPKRAKCPNCGRWSEARAGTARRPIRRATRTIVSQHVEERDGREFTVSVLASPKRAR